jgi:diguanylate cyclase (GGDEF)-like protein
VHSLAFFDPVTALPNRSGLLDHMQQTLTTGNAPAEFGMLMLGLDQFKKVNDSLGHAAGDELLKRVGERLSQSMRETDIVARLGGDTFAVLVPEVRQADALARVASKLLLALSAPFNLNDTDVFLTASIGAALYPSDGPDAESLLEHADAALSHAKARGRNNVQFYSPQLTAQASHRLTLESELRRGVERRELLLHYQPKFELGTQRLVGAEALMRWCQPQRGMVSPLSFIPLARSLRCRGGLEPPAQRAAEDGRQPVGAPVRRRHGPGRDGAGRPQRHRLPAAVAGAGDHRKPAARRQRRRAREP